MTIGTARHRLLVNPATDSRFARLTEGLAQAARTPEHLERLLRTHYARARVVRGVTDILERWYVYRDGHWVNTTDL